VCKAYKIINLPIAELAFIFHCGLSFLSYAIASPATGNLVAIALGCAKAIKVSLCALDCFNQVFFRIFPGIPNP